MGGVGGGGEKVYAPDVNTSFIFCPPETTHRGLWCNTSSQRRCHQRSLGTELVFLEMFCSSLWCGSRTFCIGQRMLPTTEKGERIHRPIDGEKVRVVYAAFDQLCGKAVCSRVLPVSVQ